MTINHYYRSAPEFDFSDPLSPDFAKTAAGPLPDIFIGKAKLKIHLRFTATFR